MSLCKHILPLAMEGHVAGAGGWGPKHTGSIFPVKIGMQNMIRPMFLKQVEVFLQHRGSIKTQDLSFSVDTRFAKQCFIACYAQKIE